MVDLVIALRDGGATVLMGNHEQMMVGAFAGEPMSIGRWFRNGARETLQSYGHPAADADEVPESLEPLPEMAEHLAFMAGLQHYHETDDTVFVHGGVDPEISLAETDPNLLLWNPGAVHLWLQRTEDGGVRAHRHRVDPRIVRRVLRR